LSAIGVDKDDCIIRWGPPNSHFWHSKKDPANGHTKSIINFDIKKSMLLGDMVQQIMAHEECHYLYDTEYPPTIRDKQAAILQMQQKAKSGQLTPDEQKAFVRARYELGLYHDVWNSAADNAVDEASHRLSSGDDPRYRYGLLPALLTNFVTLLGQGSSILEYKENGPLSPEKLSEVSANPEWELNQLSNTLFQLVSLMHGQLSNPQNREELLKDLPKIGIYPEFFKNYAHTEMTGEECFWDLYEKCKKIAQLTPDPKLMAMPKEWRKKRDEMQRQRNAIHEEIFEQYARPLIEEMVEQQKSLQEMIDELMKKQQEAGGGKGEGTPIDVPGEGGGRGNIPVYVPGPPGTNAPAEPGEGVGGEAKNVGEHEKDAFNDKNSANPEGPAKPDAAGQPKIGGLSSSGVPNMSQSAGKGASAIASINLGDGRTLAELQKDPLFRRATIEIKNILNEMMKQYSVPVHSTAKRASLRLPKGDPARTLDREAVKNYVFSNTPTMLPIEPPVAVSR
jgi:hypothetical protein